MTAADKLAEAMREIDALLDDMVVKAELSPVPMKILERASVVIAQSLAYYEREKSGQADCECPPRLHHYNCQRS